jgi:hypothetical protein
MLACWHAGQLAPCEIAPPAAGMCYYNNQQSTHLKSFLIACFERNPMAHCTMINHFIVAPIFSWEYDSHRLAPF